MNNSCFLPPQELFSRIAPTEKDDVGEDIRGIVHDESARVFARERRAVGHAGLFSNAPDLLNFLEMLLHEGEFYGRRFFSLQIIRKMRTNQISDLGQSTGLGWELNQKRFMGKQCSEHTFGKTGFTGTSVVCDIERGVAFIIFTNCTYPKRPLNGHGINRFRSDIADIVFSSM